MNATNPRGLLTYHDASTYLGIPVGTLYAWVAEHRIPHIRLAPRTIRFSVAQLDAWIEAHRVTER